MKFAISQVAAFEDVAEGFNWTPWRDGDTRQQRNKTGGTGQEPTEANQLWNWRLRGDLLRVATYYRVTGAQHTAMRRRRREAAQERFKRWAASVVEERARARRQEAEAPAAAQQGRASRKRAMPGGGYRETREYKQRATAAAMAERRRAPQRRRRTNTTTSTELGKRTRDQMWAIAERCVQQRLERRDGHLDRRGDG